MATLARRLRRELGDWSEHLPPAWKSYFEDIELNFSGVDPRTTLKASDRIWPKLKRGPRGAHIFRSLMDLTCEQVRVVIFGNDPYTKLQQATGRAFEQGDLRNWADDIRVRHRVSPSLQSILAAAAAKDVKNRCYGLLDTRSVYSDDPRHSAKPVRGNDEPLLWFAHVGLARGIADGEIKLKHPQRFFGYWSKQGVLWLNRTFTFTKWDDVNHSGHRRSHRALWRPFTQRILEVLVDQCRHRRLVFAFWGRSAQELKVSVTRIQADSPIRQGRLRIVTAGHPQIPSFYFKNGNPLEQINAQIGRAGLPIEWL